MSEFFADDNSWPALLAALSIATVICLPLFHYLDGDRW